MNQPSENKQISLNEVLEILHTQVDSMPSSPTSSRYLRALQSLKSSVFTLHSSPSYNSQLTTHNSQLTTSLTDWLINQWLMSTPFSTASLYLDIISALYGSAVKKGLLPKTDLFSQLKTQLKALGPEGWKSGIDDEIFARALRLTKNAHRLLLDDSIAANLVLWSLTHSLVPLQQAAMMKKEELEATLSKESGGNSSFIINNLSLGNARRVYVFPLRQSQRTPAQLKKHVFKIVNALFRRARLPQATDPNQTVEALWSFAALSAGIPASTLISHLGHAPLGLPILKLTQRGGEAESAEQKGSSASSAPHAPLRDKMLREVGKTFLDNPPRWYAMSLRPGVRFTQVCRRIQLLSSAHSASQPLSVSLSSASSASQPLSVSLSSASSASQPLSVPLSSAHSATQPLSVPLFYPCEEIARTIGKKIVVKQRPFIHSVVFFRARLTDIGPLFARIGDLAWCYRQSARPGAPYAEISEAQFRLFQQTIARFTPDFEVAPSGELEIKEGERVEILGGLFAGREATFEGIGKAEEGVIYRLNIIGDNGFDWRISVDKRLTHQNN